MHWGCARFDLLVVEFQGGVFLCQFGTDTQAHRLRFGAWSVRSGHLWRRRWVRAHTPVFGILTSHGGEAVAMFNLDLCNCCLSVFGVAGR